MFFQKFCFTISGIDQNRCKKVNEDFYGTAGSSAWVLDGATDVHGKVEKTGVHDFVGTLNAAMMNATDMPFKYRLSCGISEAGRHFDLTGLTEQEAPTFAVAGVRIVNDVVECYLLGDSFIAVKHQDKTVQVFRDTRIDPFRAKNRERISKLSKNAVTTANDIYKETRELANKPNGYPIGSTDPKSAKHGIVINEQLYKGDRILISTDGLDEYLGNSEIRLEGFLNPAFINKEIQNACAFYDQRGSGMDDITVILLVIH